MSIKFNGTSVDSVKYNGTTLTKVTYNGTVVYESAPPVTDTPLCFTANTAGSDMFYYCKGTRSTDEPNFDGIQKTYYTQNTPV